MPPIVQSHEFLGLRLQLREIYRRGLASGDYDVLVISRFDGNDDTLRPYLSTAYTGHHDPTLYPAALQQRAKGNTWRDADVQGGGHAEEKFIRSLNELASLFGQPELIELYVSRIPCAGRSSPWRAHKPFEEEDMLWPPGCGPKFRVAMEATPHIRWHFYWEEGYDANPKAHAESLAQLTLMSQLPNVRVAQWTP